ncbi:PspC domain-containing protein [Sphingopyxis yananensis]|jgi:phage shock protein C|uniref:PspC domain-containing protein n=1 Tax=Sphingopyxis yananensis TaxID=2886687 RepID=UPI001D128157|nr:PspC domain-containing protein [Sphingopyxis yananensis]MCC2603300.1 PspC domain-containing protein [Sphingopyxis yananensis]
MTQPFRKNRENSMISGVCAGLADQFSIDTLWVRLAFVGLTLLGFGLPVLLYILIALLTPSN